MNRDPFFPFELFEANWTRFPDFILYSDEDLSVRVIYSELIRESRGKPYCWPFISSLAAKLRLSTKTVERAIARLEEIELIEVERPSDRKDWPALQLADLETTGNRYFFRCPDWLRSTIDEGRRGPPTKPAKRTDRLKVSPLQTLSLEGTDIESVGYRQEVPSLLIKLNSQISQSDEFITASPSGTQSFPRPQKANPPHDLNTKPEDSATDESLSDLSEALPDYSAASAPQSAFDSDDVVAKGRAALRLQRASQAAQSSVEKTQETRARKIASREKRNLERAAAQRDHEPVEEPKSTPRGHLQRIWLKEISSAFPTAAIPKKFGPKEMGQVGNLLDNYDRDHVEDAFVYVIRNWAALSKRFFKSEGGFPTVGMVLRFHDTVVLEASIWMKYRAVLEEYAAFGGKYDERPRELAKRYAEAVAALEALKLG